MSDHWLAEAERRGDEQDAYASWFHSNEESLLEQYQDSLEGDDIPDDWLQTQYESYLEAEE